MPRTGLAPALGALALFTFACGGMPGSTCRTVSECRQGLSCRGPEDFGGCGVGPRRGCGSDDGCGTGRVCSAIGDSCSPSGFGSECTARCVTCEAGFTCTAAGHCEPTPCDQGFACSATQRCAAVPAVGAIYNLTHGCVSVTCVADHDCAATQACVNGRCQTGPGRCVEPMLLP